MNNIPDIDLGPHLQSFKEFTKDFSPALRGDAITNYSFVKQIHNSFARKLDMLNIDILMKNNTVAKNKSKKDQSCQEDDSETAFHFIAYMPIAENIWKFDGLQRQPQRLGKLTDADWLNQAKPDIQARIAEYEEGQIEFAVLGLVRDSLITLNEELAQNIKDALSLTSRLGGQRPTSMDDVLLGPSERLMLRQEAIDAREVSSSVQKAIKTGAEPLLFTTLQRVLNEQNRLRKTILEEIDSREAETRQVASRQHDFGPLVRKIAEILVKRNSADFVKEPKRGGAKKRR